MFIRLFPTPTGHRLDKFLKFSQIGSRLKFLAMLSRGQADAKQLQKFPEDWRSFCLNDSFWRKTLFWLIPQTVCPHYGVLTVVVKDWCCSRCPSAAPRFDCAGSHRVRLWWQCAVDRRSRDFGSFYRVSVHFLKQNVVLRDRCRRSGGFGGSKREFTWQVQGIGHFVKIVAGAVFCGRCQNVGRRVSFEGLRFTWQAQGIRTMDAMFWGRRARFLRRVAFSELELQGQFAWPVQHFVWPRVMISWQAQYFWNIFPFSRKSRTKRSFWKSGASVFEEVSHKTLVLEVRSFSFRGSLAQNARFGAPDLQFSRKSRRICSFTISWCKWPKSGS